MLADRGSLNYNYLNMKYRKIKGTDLLVSEVGFGLWTLSTGWWGTYSDEEAVRMMRLAHELGMTLFDAADTYAIASLLRRKSAMILSIIALLAAGSVKSHRIFLPRLFVMQQTPPSRD